MSLIVLHIFNVDSFYCLRLFNIVRQLKNEYTELYASDFQMPIPNLCFTFTPLTVASPFLNFG